SVGPDWDPFAMLLTFLTLVGVLATTLMFLPRLIRRLIIVVLIIVHFTGILRAIMQVPPSPWLMIYLWQTVYRPYLQFMYLNNAYHFYAPEPGPGMLLWFQVKYEDGTYQWVKLPQRQDHS